MCGKISARELVDLCADEGLEGICITDHYNEYHYRMRYRKDPGAFLEGYRIARRYGERKGLKVFLGIEYRFRGSRNDFIVFGIKESFVTENPRAHELTLGEFRETYGDLYIIQAHPLRDGGEFADLSLIDAVEAVNGNERHDEENDRVIRAASERNLTMTAASDIHRRTDVMKALMDFGDEINDIGGLIDGIKAGNYTLIDNTSGGIDS